MIQIQETVLEDCSIERERTTGRDLGHDKGGNNRQRLIDHQVQGMFAGLAMSGEHLFAGITQNDSRRMATWISCPSWRPRFRKT